MTDFVLYIPSYNDSHLVAETLTSSSDWHVVISDNCSDEPHRRALAAMASERVQVVRQPRNLGRVGNWRFCLEHFTDSGAAWFRLLVAGDRHSPGALEHLRRAAATIPDARSLIGQVEVFDRDERRVWTMEDQLIRVPPEGALRSAALHGNVFFGFCAHAVHRDALAAGFDLAEGVLSYCADFLFAVEVARAVDTYYIPVPIGQWVIDSRKTYKAKVGTLEALVEEALVRHRAAEWYGQLTGDVMERDRLIAEIGTWLEKELAQRRRV